LVHVSEPQTESSDETIVCSLGDGERVAKSVASAPALAVDELDRFSLRGIRGDGGDEGNERVRARIDDPRYVIERELPQSHRSGIERRDAVRILPTVGRQRGEGGGSSSRTTCHPADETVRGS
jgi:hypothetical protein